MKPRRVPPGWIEVVRVDDPLAGMRRVSFCGERLRHFPAACGGYHIKLFLPRSAQHRFELPTLSDAGKPLWPEADRCPVSRTYSVRRFEPQRAELDVDFVMHEHEGPASAWAARAQPGHRIGIAGPAAPPTLLQVAEFNLFAGDSSALPALSARLEVLPPSAIAHVVLSGPPALKQASLSSRADVTFQHVPARPGALLDAVRAAPWPSQRGAGRCHAWVAGESAEVVQTREFLRHSLGLQRSQMYTVPYWKADHSEEAYHAERHRIMDAMEES